MKKLLLFTALILSFSTTHAKDQVVNGLYQIDMTKRPLIDREFNLLDDGINEEFDDYAIVIRGSIDKDFMVSTETNSATVSCNYEIIKFNSEKTLLKVNQNLETDGEDFCLFTFKYNDGKVVTLRLVSNAT